LLGGKCSVADFKEVAADHGHDLESSSEDLVVSPAHYAAAAAEPNFEVLQAMTMMNLKIFHQKTRMVLCHCTMLRATESVEALSTSYSRTHPRREL
jgi:hypothetical protein